MIENERGMRGRRESGVKGVRERDKERESGLEREGERERKRVRWRERMSLGEKERGVFVSLREGKESVEKMRRDVLNTREERNEVRRMEEKRCDERGDRLRYESRVREDEGENGLESYDEEEYGWSVIELERDERLTRESETREREGDMMRENSGVGVEEREREEKERERRREGVERIRRRENVLEEGERRESGDERVREKGVGRMQREERAGEGGMADRESLSSSSSNTDRLAVIVSKLDNLGGDMKKLKENIHAIQVNEAKYGEFGCPAPFNESNGAKYRVGLRGYYTRTNNQPPYGEKRPKVNTRNQSASLKNLETQIEQLTKELHSRATNEIPSSSTGQCKMVNTDHETPSELNNLHEVSFLSDSDSQVGTTEILQHNLPPTEQNPRDFTLPCTIGNFNFYAMADLEASVNVMPKGIFDFLKLNNLRKTNMLIEMADMTKKAPLGMVENVLVGIDKFLFPSDFVIIDRTPNETVILGRPFLTIYGGGQLNDSTWGQSYAEWYKENSHDNKPKPRDYNFKEWMIVKVGHTNVNESVKKALLKSSVIDCFKETLDPDKDIRGRSFDDYKWVFDLEIEQLADEYELEIRKKGHMLEMIWENYKNIQGKAKEWWYDYWLEEDKKRENGDKKYDPPQVHLEIFEVTRYSFDNGNSFICVTIEIKDTLSLGRENGSRFKKMIRQEMNLGEGAHNET
ncbi:mutator type transposase [Tanacetum coccineum]|uniref:Mutator type transposase n=1 Tax=Tanacetum coccineum TaxID=301880 RepID=A0ABQ4WDK2_9ASTR